MPITWRHEFMLVCDNGCGAELILDDVDTPFHNPTPKTFRRIAKKIGWKIDRYACFCPKCKKEREDA